MTDLFLRILNLSFSATWVVLAVVIARLLLKKAPRRLICALWALVALRLLFGGLEAPFSLIPSSELIPPDSLYDETPAIQSGKRLGGHRSAYRRPISSSGDNFRIIPPRRDEFGRDLARLVRGRLRFFDMRQPRGRDY